MTHAKVSVHWSLLQRVYALLEAAHPNRPETEELFNAMVVIDAKGEHG